MSWLFSRALVEDYANSPSSPGPAGESSAGTSLDGAPCAELNVMPSPHPFWRNDKTIDASGLSRFGPTCRVLTAECGVALLKSYLAAFPAPILVLPARVPGSTEPSLGSGEKCAESLATLDPATSSLKTRQLSLFGGGCESLQTLPPWGMIVAGELYPLPTPSGLLELRASITSESGSGLPERAPTPTAGDAKSSGSRNLEGSKAHAGVSLTDYVKTGNSTTPRRVPTPTAHLGDPKRGMPSPELAERRFASGRRNLEDAVMLVPRVPTPLSSDARSPGFDAGRQGAQSLGVVIRVPTPNTPNGGRSTKHAELFGNSAYDKNGKKVQVGLESVVRRLPTPTTQDASNNGPASQMNRNTKPLNAEVGGPLNPEWVEWLVGWPIGWTDLNAPGTAKFQVWCASHGRY